MLGFYRQSLLQSQPWHGFVEGSKNLAKKAQVIHKKMPTLPSSDSPVLSDSAFLEDPELDWSDIEGRFI
ncbi:MAG: hypothetical protein LCH90_23795 [Proteobacteria bacterium]|nr:hypothetical protein [Pseudomonadota bacterium]